MSKLYSFKSAKDQVIIDEPYAWFNTESGDVLITDDFHAERVALTRYPDVYHGNAEFIDGFKGEDLIFSENPDVVMRGGDGPDTLLNGHQSGGTAFGGKGDDFLRADEMTGGSGADAFQFIAYYQPTGWFTNYDATIHDFEPGEDVLRIVARDDPILTNEGDVWTVTSNDSLYGGTFEASLTIEGVTELAPTDVEWFLV
jgi:Ca2+-binding RTX toxin-like protein